jgi:hypothetical protein
LAETDADRYDGALTHLSEMREPESGSVILPLRGAGAIASIGATAALTAALRGVVGG